MQITLSYHIPPTIRRPYIVLLDSRILKIFGKPMRFEHPNDAFDFIETVSKCFDGELTIHSA